MPTVAPGAASVNGSLPVSGTVTAARAQDFLAFGVMADGEVFVIDRVLTRPGCARAFVDRYANDYVPGALARGMTLREVLVSPPIWLDNGSNTVTITWTLPSPRAWWEMTWKGRPDPDLGPWWDGLGELVLERTRSVAAAAGDVDGLCDV